MYKKDKTILKLRVKPLNNHSTIHYIKIRPYLEDFLKEVSKDYEIFVFTRLTEAFTEKFLKKVDPMHHIKKSFCRKDQIPYE